MNLSILYLREIALWSKRWLQGRYEQSDPLTRYEAGRAQLLEEMQGSEWDFDQFVFGEMGDTTSWSVARIVDGQLTRDPVRERQLMLNALTEAIKAFRPVTLVEIGAGTGRNLAWLTAKLGGSGLGVELSPSSVEVGNLAAGRLGLPFSMVTGDVTEVDIPPADVVFSVHALEQIPDAGPVVEKMVDAARTGVVMVEPFPEFWPRGLGWAAHWIRARGLDRLRRGALDSIDYEARLLPFGTALNRASLVVHWREIQKLGA